MHAEHPFHRERVQLGFASPEDVTVVAEAAHVEPLAARRQDLAAPGVVGAAKDLVIAAWPVRNRQILRREEESAAPPVPAHLPPMHCSDACSRLAHDISSNFSPAVDFGGVLPLLVIILLVVAIFVISPSHWGQHVERWCCRTFGPHIAEDPALVIDLSPSYSSSLCFRCGCCSSSCCRPFFFFFVATAFGTTLVPVLPRVSFHFPCGYQALFVERIALAMSLAVSLSRVFLNGRD